ncbi:hypothetical protein [Pseudomonas sp. FME51]|uniref:hypothetical protein n=1 Tax=Pseudomonas sp. FME51 TaxID=2742609 RepID=UPI00186633EB|nr:hypothetical protein [Pseudomonas sp. FME51]
MKPMNAVRRYGARIGGAVAAVAVISPAAHAAIDTAGVINEITGGGVSAGEIIGALLIFGAIMLVGFTLYRRLR